MGFLRYLEPSNLENILWPYEKLEIFISVVIIVEEGDDSVVAIALPF